MKYAWSTTLMLFAVIVSGSVSADDFSDFRIPAHRRTDWDASLSAAGNRFSGSDFSGTDTKDRFVAASGGSSFAWVADSDPVSTLILADVRASGNGRWRSSVSPPIPGVSEDANREERAAFEAWQVLFDHRHYPWAIPIGFSGRAFGSGNYNQVWSEQSTGSTQMFVPVIVDEASSSSETWAYRTVLGVDIGAGFGRVRDATAIYDAQVLERRLRETGALSRDLSAPARRDLAGLLFVRDDYSRFRDRPAKRLWEKVEAILEQDGALVEGGLDPYSVLRVGEPDARDGLNSDALPRSPVLRLSGAFVQGVFTFRETRVLQRLDEENEFQQFIDDSLAQSYTTERHFHQDYILDEAFAGLRGELHRPLGPPWQVDVSAQFLVPTRARPYGFELRTWGRLAWLMTDRWIVSGSVSQARTLLQDDSSTFGDPVRDEDSWSWSYALGATYYFEDRLGMTLRLDESQFHLASSYQQSLIQRSGQISLALSYRILGSFDAPGLIPHEGLSVTR